MPLPEDDPLFATMRARIAALQSRNEQLEAIIAQAGEVLGRDDASRSGRANAWLAAIVESSDDAIVSKDLNGIVTSWNPAAERIFGYSAREMIGASILSIIPEELKGEERHILSKVRSGERIDRYRTVRRRKDGTRIEISVIVSPVRDATGHIVGASKIARDVTGRDDSERASGLLAAIVESSDDAIVSKDLGGTITSWNRTAERLYGFGAAEMIGRPMLRIIPPELHSEEGLILSKVRAGERLEHFETVRMRKDGSRVEVSLTVSPVRDGAGRIIGVSNVSRDLTAQRRAERAEATLAAIVRSSDDAIISKSLDGIVTSWNPAAERLYGYRVDEIVGRSILRIIPEDLRSEEDFILGKIRAGERLEHFPTVRVRKDGTRVPVSITVSPLRDALGRLIGASKIARDESARVEDQRRKDEFLAILAHELRNPMAAIRNALTLLGQAGLDAPGRARAQAIAGRQLQHMGRLLDDLLDVSRLATGRVELRCCDVELGRLVEEALEATRALFEARGQRLDVERAPEPIALHADAARITQAVVNLLTNASKYTDAGGRIALRVAREGAEAVVRVSDDGIGFSAAMKDRLFQLFSQEESALTRSAGGLGIGLALVREFIQRHGGSVQAESPGRGLGSTFTIRLPVAAQGDAR